MADQVRGGEVLNTATITIPLTDYNKIAREHERMRSALLAIKAHAEMAILGGWRHDIHRMATMGLKP